MQVVANAYIFFLPLLMSDLVIGCMNLWSYLCMYLRSNNLLSNYFTFPIYINFLHLLLISFFTIKETHVNLKYFIFHFWDIRAMRKGSNGVTCVFSFTIAWARQFTDCIRRKFCGFEFFERDLYFEKNIFPKIVVMKRYLHRTALWHRTKFR